MKIDIITIFPELFSTFLDWSMVKKAQKIKKLKIKVHNLRDWGIDKRGTVDDRSYGGGPGMILRPEPIFKAIKDLKTKDSKIILLSAKGKLLKQAQVRKMSKNKHLVLICGHYEGVDERVSNHMVDEETSIGNYVLTGGELPAMVVTEAIARLLPGVLEKTGASEIESFSPGLSQLVKEHQNTSDTKNLIEYPQYTRPPEFNGWKVPKILLSGDHKKITDWRVKKTKTKED